MAESLNTASIPSEFNVDTHMDELSTIIFDNTNTPQEFSEMVTIKMSKIIHNSIQQVINFYNESEGKKKYKKQNSTRKDFSSKTTRRIKNPQDRKIALRSLRSLAEISIRKKLIKTEAFTVVINAATRTFSKLESKAYFDGKRSEISNNSNNEAKLAEIIQELHEQRESLEKDYHNFSLLSTSTASLNSTQVIIVSMHGVKDSTENMDSSSFKHDDEETKELRKKVDTSLAVVESIQNSKRTQIDKVKAQYEGAKNTIKKLEDMASGHFNALLPKKKLDLETLIS